MGLSINDSVYSSIFFFLTGLHFFHLVVGLLLLSLLSWSCSFSSLTGLLQLQEEDLIEEEDCKRQDNERNVH
jgi:heme/copper-type cytochrome/quinol oxidase subunit 3